jgi:type IV pilus assembly protein PilP
MKNLRLFQFLSYILVAVIAVGMAFGISLRFLGKTYSQTPAKKAVDPNAKNTPTPQTPPGQESASAVAAEVQGFLEPFIYDSKNRRDPFQPFAEYRPVEQQTSLLLSPLQRFELDDLHLIGIMWDVHAPKAMFLDPEKQVHVVSRDESIGRRNGYVATIREGEVVVVESARKDGEVIFKTKVLRMER